MRPLDGVRVLDLSRLLPGPYCTLLLSDLGAEVIKVEDPNGGDYARYYPPALEDGLSAVFHALNRGKRSVALDLKSEADKAAFEELCESSHVVVESFRPGVMEKLGLGPERLHELNPELIICRISGYGQNGPKQHDAGHDINYAAQAGVLGMMRIPDVLPVQIGDLAGGAWPAALQIVAALFGQERGEGGAVIDVSMTDWARAMLLMPLARHAADGQEIGGGADLLAGGVPCYEVYATMDGYLAVGALEPKFWERFCQAVGLEHLAHSGMATGEEAAEVRAAISACLRAKSCAEWEEVLAGVDCCVEVVRSPETERGGEAGPWTGQEVEVGGAKIRLPMPPLSLAEGRPDEPAPALGADTEALTGKKG